MATRLFGGVKTGATSVSLDALLIKTDGTPDTGRVAANLTAYYYRQGASATASVTLSDLAALNTAFTAGGVKAIGDGTYRVDWPDAAFASGADWVELTAKDGTTAIYKERVALESAGPSDLATTIGAAGAGLTALGDTRLAYLDAAVTSRSTYAGGAVASVTAPVTLTSAYDAAKTAATQASVSAIPTNPLTAAVLAAMLPTNFGALAVDSSGRVVLQPSGVDAIQVETGVNLRQSMSPVLAAAAGVLSGADSGSIVIKGGNVATTRITATGDAYGNRTNVVLNLPA